MLTKHVAIISRTTICQLFSPYGDCCAQCCSATMVSDRIDSLEQLLGSKYLYSTHVRRFLLQYVAKSQLLSFTKYGERFAHRANSNAPLREVCNWKANFSPKSGRTTHLSHVYSRTLSCPSRRTSSSQVGND